MWAHFVQPHPITFPVLSWYVSWFCFHGIGRVCKHSSAHLSTWRSTSNLRTLSAIRLRLCRSTTIRCSLRTLGALSSSRWINSTNSRAGELQALQKGGIIRYLQRILILETEHRVVLVIKPTEAGTIFQAANDSRGSNQSTHVQFFFCSLLALILTFLAPFKGNILIDAAKRRTTVLKSRREGGILNEADQKQTAK